MIAVGVRVIGGGLTIIGVIVVVTLLVGVPIGALTSTVVDTSAATSDARGQGVGIIDDHPELLGTLVRKISAHGIPVALYPSCLSAGAGPHHRVYVIDYSLGILWGDNCAENLIQLGLARADKIVGFSADDAVKAFVSKGVTNFVIKQPGYIAALSELVAAMYDAP